jgi:hypothetical protein
MTHLEVAAAQVSFADPLRAMLQALGIPHHVLTNPSLKETSLGPLYGNRTPRYLLQTLGTEWGRELVSPELWLGLVESSIERNLTGGRSVVIDDVRFDNEADLIRKLGGIVVRIKNVSESPDPSIPEHVSEAGVSKVDATIVYDLNSPRALVMELNHLVEVLRLQRGRHT